MTNAVWKPLPEFIEKIKDYVAAFFSVAAEIFILALIYQNDAGPSLLILLELVHLEKINTTVAGLERNVGFFAAPAELVGAATANHVVASIYFFDIDITLRTAPNLIIQLVKLVKLIIQLVNTVS